VPDIVVPEYVAPGVYVEEVSYRAKSIDGVETSTAAFIGRARAGPPEPVRVTSFFEYERLFGPVDRERTLGHAVRAFFQNGGSRTWVVRVPDTDPLSGGLEPLEEVRDVGLLCLPGETDAEILRRALDLAERRGMFLIADAMDLDPQAAVRIAHALANEKGARNGALYWPTLLAEDRDGAERVLPPSGAVAGVYARVDGSRGVWKAPGNGIVLGAQRTAADVNDVDAEELADAGVNAIRAFRGRGIRVWGSRTLASDTEWKYVNVRRLVVFLERSLDRGTQWTVFEPNDEPLWAQVRAAAGVFLNDLWRQGAFAGGSPREAFFVRCDRSTMTQDDIDRGRLVLEIGIAPVRPAEFVIIRIARKLAGVACEIVGESTGEPGFELRLPHRWVDPSTVAVIVEGERGWTAWNAVADPSKSGPDDAIYVIEVDDDGYAVIRFGDAEHGDILPKAARVQATYRYGGGRLGNAPQAGEGAPSV
jgi:Bacteriophage tail sheath protein